jgi:hypothetical protein
MPDNICIYGHAHKLHLQLSGLPSGYVVGRFAVSEHGTWSFSLSLHGPQTDYHCLLPYKMKIQ